MQPKINVDIQINNLYNIVANQLIKITQHIIQNKILLDECGFNTGDGTYCLYNYRIEELRDIVYGIYPKWFLKGIQNESLDLIKIILEDLFEGEKDVRVTEQMGRDTGRDGFDGNESSGMDR
jgi:hypothetical protein